MLWHKLCFVYYKQNTANFIVSENICKSHRRIGIMTQFTSLTSVVTKLRDFGEEYAAKNAEGSFIQSTKGLFDRFILWFKGKSNPIVQGNKDAIRSISSDIKEALGEKYQTEFLSFLGDFENSSRPVKSRQLADAIESTLMLRSAKVEVFMSSVATDLEDILSVAMDKFSIEPERASDLLDRIKSFVAKDLQQFDNYEYPFEGEELIGKLKGIVESEARSMILDIVGEKREQIKSIITERLTDGKPLATAPPNIEALTTAVLDLLVNGELASQFDTSNLNELLTAGIQSIVEQFNTQVEAIQTSELDDSHKTILLNTFMQSGKIIGEQRLELMINSFSDTVDFLHDLLPHRCLLTKVSAKAEVKAFSDELDAKLAALGEDLTDVAATASNKDFYELLISSALQTNIYKSDSDFHSNFSALLFNTLYDIQSTDEGRLADFANARELLKQVFYLASAERSHQHFFDFNGNVTIDLDAVPPGMILHTHLVHIAEANNAMATLPSYVSEEEKQKIQSRIQAEIVSAFYQPIGKVIHDKYHEQRAGLQEDDRAKLEPGREARDAYLEAVGNLKRLERELAGYFRIEKELVRLNERIETLPDGSEPYRTTEAQISQLTLQRQSILRDKIEVLRNHDIASQVLRQATAEYDLYKDALQRVESFDNAERDFTLLNSSELLKIRGFFPEIFLKDFDRASGLSVNGVSFIPASPDASDEEKIAVFQSIIDSFRGDTEQMGKVLGALHQGFQAITLAGFMELPAGKEFLSMEPRDVSSDNFFHITGPGMDGTFSVSVDHSKQRPTSFFVSNVEIIISGLSEDVPTFTIGDVKAMYSV